MTVSMVLERCLCFLFGDVVSRSDDVGLHEKMACTCERDKNPQAAACKAREQVPGESKCEQASGFLRSHDSSADIGVEPEGECLCILRERQAVGHGDR